MGEFFNKTKKLIEETYDKNGNRSVVMVAHSMGNLVMLYFYNHVVSGQWKDKYIRAHVALSAPWAGSVKSLKLMCSGQSLKLMCSGQSLKPMCSGQSLKPMCSGQCLKLMCSGQSLKLMCSGQCLKLCSGQYRGGGGGKRVREILMG